MENKDKSILSSNQKLKRFFDKINAPFKAYNDNINKLMKGYEKFQSPFKIYESNLTKIMGNNNLSKIIPENNLSKIMGNNNLTKMIPENNLTKISIEHEKFQSIFKVYEDALKPMRDLQKALTFSLDVYIKSPQLELFNEMQSVSGRLEKELKDVENNVWYQMALKEVEESEKAQKEKDQCIKELNNKVKELEKEKEEAQQILELARYIISRDKEKNTTLQIQPNPTRKKLTLKPDFLDIDNDVKVINEYMSELLQCEMWQWHNLFSDDIKIFSKPMIIKDIATLADIEYFFNSLLYYGAIQNAHYKKVIEQTKAIRHKGKLIISRQLTDAKYYGSEEKNKHIIDNLINELKID